MDDLVDVRRDVRLGLLVMKLLPIEDGEGLETGLDG